MTVTVEPDIQGIAALRGDTDDSAMLPPVLWDQLVAEWGEMPAVPVIEPFDEQPWLTLPTLQELEQLWLVSPLVDIMVAQLALKVHGDGSDLPKFLAHQRWMADMEVELARGREVGDNGRERAVDDTAPGEPAAVVSVEGGGGGGSVPGGPEDGVAVGGGGETPDAAHSGRAPAVSGKRRPRDARGKR